MRDIAEPHAPRARGGDGASAASAGSAAAGTLQGLAAATVLLLLLLEVPPQLAPPVRPVPPQVAPPVRRLRDDYSSFECVGLGNQVFNTLTHRHGDLTGGGRWDVKSVSAHHMPHSICKLHDVCFVEGQLTYFSSPFENYDDATSMGMGAFPDGGPSCIGMIGGDTEEFCRKSPTITVVAAPRPAHLRFAHDGEGWLHALDRMSDPSNYAHLLGDSLMPAFSGAAIFGDDPLRIALVSVNNCSTFCGVPGMRHMPCDVPLPNLGGLYPRDLCRHNLNQWGGALLAGYQLPPHADGCFEDLMLGHSHALSLGHNYPHRGLAMRMARVVAHSHLGLPLPEKGPPLAELHVQVWIKGIVNSAPVGLDVCNIVQSWIPASVRVTCISPSKMTAREQIEAIANVSVVVTEHGSTTHLSSFMRPGSSLLVFGNREAFVTFTNPDVRALYVDPNEALTGTGYAAFMLSIVTAGKRLGLGLG